MRSRASCSHHDGCLELMARAAEALHYAHGQHVVHRDVKPANLLYDAETDTLKITDFGIARLTDTSRTKTGIILGTPSYMSPEQLAGTNVTGQIRPVLAGRHALSAADRHRHHFAPIPFPG